MACTDDTSNRELVISLARMLIAEITTGEAPPTPLLVALSEFESQSGAEIIAAYRAAEAQGDRYDLSESEGLLNVIGYTLLGQERTSDAVEVFTLNTELFPDSPNTYDSLGEALWAAGEPEAALERYRKVLELDPGNANATAMIEKIEGDS